MPSPASESVALNCQVRARRETLHRRPSELAQQCGITRQALHSIESGAYVPNTVISLKLAQALSCRVEDLFTLPEAQFSARLIGDALPTGGRVQLAWVGTHLLAFPVSGEAGWGQPADGTVSGCAPLTAQPEQVEVQLFADQGVPRRTGVLVGCDPSLGVAASHVGRLNPETRLLWQSASSLKCAAVAGARRGPRGGHSPVGRALGRLEPAVRPARAARSAGASVHPLVVGTGPDGRAGQSARSFRARRICSRPGLRMVNREKGSGSRTLLDAWLAELHLPVAGAPPSFPATATRPTATWKPPGRWPPDGPTRLPARAPPRWRWAWTSCRCKRERFDLVVPRAAPGPPGHRGADRGGANVHIPG